MNFLTVEQVSSLLNMKRSSVYGLVESGVIPYYRIGRLIRFKEIDIESWMEGHRREALDVNKKARTILKNAEKRNLDIDRIVKKTVADFRGNEYTLNHGRPDRIRGLGKEAEDGTF